MGWHICLATPSGHAPKAPDLLQTSRVGRWPENADLCPNLVITFHWSHCVVCSGAEERPGRADRNEPDWTRTGSNRQNFQTVAASGS